MSINLLPPESLISHTTSLNGIRLRDINVRSAEEHGIAKLHADCDRRFKNIPLISHRDSTGVCF